MSNEKTDAIQLRLDSKPMKLATVLGMPPEYVQLVKDVTAPKATEEEFCLFLQIVHDTGLNPLNREIWFYKMWDGIAGRDMPVIHASIQGRRKAAERIGGYCPGRETEYKYDNEGYLLSATAYVKRKVDGDWQEVAFTAHWDEFCKYKRDGKTPSGKWDTMPRHMLGKCAETHCLNRAFPTLESLADTEATPTAAFKAAFNTPEAEPEITKPNPETERRRGILKDNLSVMAGVLSTPAQQEALAAWTETAAEEALAEKHNTALAQFLKYGRGVYEAIPDAEKQAALESFNCTEFDDLGFEEVTRFIYTFQKPVEDQMHPANVPEPPPEEKPKARGGRRR